MNDIFVSSASLIGDLAGVFEYEDDVGYFYLYDQSIKEGSKIKKAIKVCEKDNNVTEGDILIDWSEDFNILFLKIYNIPCVVIDIENGISYEKQLGDQEELDLPEDIAKRMSS